LELLTSAAQKLLSEWWTTTGGCSRERSAQPTPGAATRARIIAMLQETCTKFCKSKKELRASEATSNAWKPNRKTLSIGVDFVTVNLQLMEEYKAQLNPPAPSISTRLHNALVEGYRNASETVLGIVLFFAECGLTLLIWALVLLLPAAWFWRRYHRSVSDSPERDFLAVEQ
jgi:hypothetical protein